MTFSNESIEAVRSRFIPPGHASLNAVYAESARGALIWDVEGREYIDFAGGIGVMNVGHSHPKVVAAIKAQADRFTHTCFMVVPYESTVRLAEKLCTLAPVVTPSMALFVNSGAEAVENAIKIARYATKKAGIITFENAYHGRTLLTMSLTSKVKPYKFGFGPFSPEIYRMPFAYCYRCPFGVSYPSCGVTCADYLKDFFISHIAPEMVAAVIAEPIQGEGGFITPPPEYFSKLTKICHDHNILFIADEIQSGMGRTGTMFATEHWNVQPDLMTVAKSLAAGMPLSAVVGRQEIMEAVHPSGLGGTYGANPVACSAALAVFDIFSEERLLEKSKTLGQKLLHHFLNFQKEFEIIGDVRGKGPMLAMELVKSREGKEPATDKAKSLVKYCFDHGLILLSCGNFGNVIRTLMPLVITDEQLERGVSILNSGLKTLEK